MVLACDWYLYWMDELTDCTYIWLTVRTQGMSVVRLSEPSRTWWVRTTSNIINLDSYPSWLVHPSMYPSPILQQETVVIKYCSLWSTYCNSRRNSTYWPHPSREDTGIVVREVTSREGALLFTLQYSLCDCMWLQSIISIIVMIMMMMMVMTIWCLPHTRCLCSPTGCSPSVACAGYPNLFSGPPTDPGLLRNVHFAVVTTEHLPFLPVGLQPQVSYLSIYLSIYRPIHPSISYQSIVIRL